MKSPRAIILSDELITKHKLSTDAPPKDSLFWTMWNSCNEIANEALESGFVQGIKEGNLDPVKYGGFNVSDAYYCFNGAQDYYEAANRATDATLKAFLMQKYQSYENYVKTFPKTWHIKDADGIVPTDVCKAYSNFETEVASQENAIYCLVVMLPCDYLWAWLGEQLMPPVAGNLYSPWITGNNNPSGAYAMGNFIELFQKEHPGSIDQERAIQIYSQAMTYEKENFATATL